MGRADYRRCRNCNRLATEVGELSHTRLCTPCGRAIERENALQIHAESGPYYERRRYGYARHFYGARVALALKQAGVFDTSAVDSPPAAP